jgi:hypothetical protein
MVFSVLSIMGVVILGAAFVFLLMRIKAAERSIAELDNTLTELLETMGFSKTHGEDAMNMVPERPMRRMPRYPG